MSEFVKEKVKYLPDHLAHEKFGAYDQKELVFTNDERPYKRCLNFHAIVAQQFAFLEGWIENVIVEKNDWSAEEFGSKTESVKNWLDGLTAGNGIDDSQSLNISYDTIDRSN